VRGRPCKLPLQSLDDRPHFRAQRALHHYRVAGAKSGEPREAIVTYSRDGDRYVIAASKSGAPDNPAWYHNLRAHPQVSVETGGETFRARASVANGEERERLWNQHATELPQFQEYPTKTERVIPVIVLERAA